MIKLNESKPLMNVKFWSQINEWIVETIEILIEYAK
jgi:hypothetical protein